MSLLHNDDLSSNLDKTITRFFGAHAEKKAVSLSADDVSNLVNRLSLLSKLAVSMERELTVHRLGELNRVGREFVEQLATEELKAMKSDPEGKIITPDFRRK